MALPLTTLDDLERDDECVHPFTLGLKSTMGKGGAEAKALIEFGRKKYNVLSYETWNGI